MEAATTGSPAAALTIKPNTIKAAQEEMGRLDVLLCGQCHAVFHFIEEFQQHRSKEGACSKVSNFRENNTIEQKAQVWAFLLWKDTQNQQDSPDKESKEGSWKLYQKWCKMDNHTRDGWILAGKTIQTFTKISNAKMQDVPQSGNAEGGKTVVLRKVIRNGQPESPDKKDFKSDLKVKTQFIDSKEKLKLKSPIKSKTKSTEDDDNVDSDDEYYVEQIMAKRFNPKRKVYEYLLKWKKRNSPLFSKDHYNTWEDVAHVSMTYKHLMDDFESNLAKQKEIKAQQVAKSINKANQLGLGQKNAKQENAKAGPSNTSQGGRPMRVSKTKATDQMKKWCGSMRDDDVLGKRKLGSYDSDSDDGDIGTAKRNKMDTSGEDDEWASDSQDDKTLIGRRDVIQRAFRGANLQSNGSRLTTGNELTNNIGSNKGTRIEAKPTGTSQSNVYIMHKKEGIIKLDSSPTNKLSVKGASNQTPGGMLIMRNNSPIVRKQVVSASSHGNAITPVKVMTKPDGTQVVTQMQIVTSKASPAKPGALTTLKSEPVKIQPRPDPNQSQQQQQMQQIHLVTAIPSSMSVQTQRVVTTSTPTAKTTGVGSRADNSQRPLLPRPSVMGRTSTPVLTGTGLTAQSRTVVRSQQPQRQGATHTTILTTPSPLQQQQQRPVVQKRILPGSTTTTLLQSSTPGVPSATPKAKVTVMNAQGKVLNKPTVVGQQQTKISPKATPTSSRSQTAATPQQKMMLARKKLAAEAGVVPKPVGRSTIKSTSVVRAKANSNQQGNNNNKPKESKLAETDGLHMEFHEVESENSSSETEPEFPPLPVEAAQPCPEPDSPPRQLTLCPLTGRLIGPDGKPIEQPEPEPEPQVPTPMAIVSASAAMASGVATISADGIIASTASGETTELVLPNLESFSDGAGGIVRVEMSPGGTTGIVVQTSEAPSTSATGMVMPGPDMPSLDDPSVEIQTTSAGEVVVNVAPISTSMDVTSASDAATITTVAEATTTTLEQPAAEQPLDSSDAAVLMPKQEVTAANSKSNSSELVHQSIGAGTNVKLEENSGVVTITGDDGVLYQVAGQSVDGQTLLVAQGADGEQQCVYVTTAEQGTSGEEGPVLTLDHAVAEAVAHLMPDQVNVGSQFYVKEGAAEETVEASDASNAENQQMVVYNTNTMEDTDNQVVAQVISAEEPTEDGVRKVVLLLPDGNMMMTEVDEEQYAALELDK